MTITYIVYARGFSAPCFRVCTVGSKAEAIKICETMEAKGYASWYGECRPEHALTYFDQEPTSESPQ